MGKKLKWVDDYFTESLSPMDERKFGPDPISSRLNGTKRNERRINQYFDQDMRKFLLDCVNGEYDDDDASNVNKVAELIKERLTPLGFREIGVGSNRIVFLKDGYAYKIAMDRRGCVDNMSEYLRSVEEPDLLAKVYETNRLVAVVEYCKLISAEEFAQHKDAIREMLMYLSKRYVMQDLGTTEKNYCNIGLRNNGTLVFIDYAYMYKIAGNEDALRCRLCGGLIRPNDNFTAYKCSNRDCEQPYLTYEIINHMQRDVDECDDASVIELIGADDEGTDSSNFTYVKITGEDTGDMDFISDTEAQKAKEIIEQKRLEEQEYLSKASSIQEASIDDLEVEKSDDTPKVPSFKMKTEGVEALTRDEVSELQRMIDDRKRKDDGKPLYTEEDA